MSDQTCSASSTSRSPSLPQSAATGDVGGMHIAPPSPKRCGSEGDERQGTIHGSCNGRQQTGPSNGSVQGFLSGCDDGNGVILRLEYMTQHELKILVGVIWTVTMFGFVTLVALFAVKSARDTFFIIRKDYYFILCCVDAGVQIIGCTGLLVLFAKRIEDIQHEGYTWPRRQRVICWLYIVEVAAQWLNACLYFALNVLELVNPCALFSTAVYAIGTVRWSLWVLLLTLPTLQATVFSPFRQPTHHFKSLGALSLYFHKARCALRPKGNYRLALDAPFWYFWPVALLWAIAQSIVLALFISTIAAPRLPSPVERCPTMTCPDTSEPLSYLESATFILLAATYIFTVIVIHMRLQRVAYVQYRTAIVSIRLQLQTQLYVVLVVALCFFLLYLLDVAETSGCKANFFGVSGMLPIEFTNGYFILVIAWAHVPVLCREEALVHAQLRHFDWTEQDHSRRHPLHPSSINARKDSPTIVFCLETALKLAYWSYLLYEYQAGYDDNVCDIATGLDLYNLRHYKLVWDRKSDIKCIVAWGNGCVLACFRGTDSMANAILDIKAWRVAHPPKRGSALMHTRPLVHRGFLKAWECNGFKNDLLPVVTQAVSHEEMFVGSTGMVKIFITGHSLGGALACLAAYDIVNMFQDYGNVSVCCYTFGAPRVGNHAFCRDIDRVVPHTWHVINGQDVVARSFKFGRLYKRHGQRTIIDGKGDIIVRPTFLEVGVHNSFVAVGAPSVRHHLLTSYAESFHKLMYAQANPEKMQKGGAKGAAALLQQEGTHTVLQNMCGVDVEDLRERLAGVMGDVAVVPRHGGDCDERGLIGDGRADVLQVVVEQDGREGKEVANGHGDGDGDEEQQGIGT